MPTFKEKLEPYFDELLKTLQDDEGNWRIRGFIDDSKKIYTISVDTKVVSKIIELQIFPIMEKFAKENDYDIKLAVHQNHYPDITFISKDEKEKVALDLKSTYKISDEKVSGLTLGAFTGYFRNRDSTKNITFPYDEYTDHYILGIVYYKSDINNTIKEFEKNGLGINNGIRKLIETYLKEPTEETLNSIVDCYGFKEGEEKEFHKEIIEYTLNEFSIDERTTYELENLSKIPSVIGNFDIFCAEKWQICVDRPGSGNTKNIGGITDLNDLKNGNGLFAKTENGKQIFNDYWQTYMTKDMADAAGLAAPPFNNLTTYLAYKEEQKDAESRQSNSTAAEESGN